MAEVGFNQIGDPRTFDAHHAMVEAVKAAFRVLGVDGSAVVLVTDGKETCGAVKWPRRSTI